MSKRVSSTILQDILFCIDHIMVYTDHMSFEDFLKESMVSEACLYNIQIIGEAVNHLPDGVKDKAPEIPWTLIRGMRNRLIHEYFGTDLEVVWNVIKNELPTFKSMLERLRDDLLSNSL